MWGGLFGDRVSTEPWQIREGMTTGGKRGIETRVSVRGSYWRAWGWPSGGVSRRLAAMWAANDWSGFGAKVLVATMLRGLIVVRGRTRLSVTAAICRRQDFDV